MDDYNDEEINELVTKPDVLTNFEGYALGFMMGFMNKMFVNPLRTSITTLRETQPQVSTSCTKALNFANILFNAGAIDKPSIQTITLYLEQVKTKIEKDCPYLENYHLFYLGRFHSLYNQVDIKAELNRANIRTKIKRLPNSMQDLRQRVSELTQGELFPERNLQLLYTLSAPLNSKDKLTVKIEPTIEEVKSPIIQMPLETLNNHEPPSEFPVEKTSMEIEVPNVFQNKAPVIEEPKPSTLPNFKDKKIAKKSSKVPPKKPESPIPQPEQSKQSEQSLNYQPPHFLTSQNGPLYELINQTSDFIPTQQPTTFDLENLCDTLKQNHQSSLQTNQSIPNVEEEPVFEKKTKSDKVDIEESKFIIPMVRNALFSNKKSDIKRDMEIENTTLETNLEENKDALSEINYELYDISYCSSDDMSFKSSPRLPQGKELVLSYATGSEFDEDREISIDENINVFDKPISCK